MADDNSEALTVWIDRELIDKIDEETDNRSQWVREAIKMRLNQDPLEERFRKIEERLELLRKESTEKKGLPTLSTGGGGLSRPTYTESWEELEAKHGNEPIGEHNNQEIKTFY